MPNYISGDDVEQALLDRLAGAGFASLNCYTERKETLPDGSSPRSNNSFG